MKRDPKDLNRMTQTMSWALHYKRNTKVSLRQHWLQGENNFSLLNILDNSCLVKELVWVKFWIKVIWHLIYWYSLVIQIWIFVVCPTYYLSCSGSFPVWYFAYLSKYICFKFVHSIQIKHDKLKIIFIWLTSFKINL